MASTSANTFYAKPVFLGSDKERTHKPSVNDTGQRISVRHKQIRFSDIDSSPPPRPPPPRPVRKPILSKSDDVQQSSRERRRQLPPTPHDNISTPEPKPLTRTNVTSHERLWQKDIDNENSGPSDILSPPLKYITPQTTEEMMRNFDPLDIIDSTSDHSDSSADTMIMMTTEEERKNQERINHSLKEYTSLKTKPDYSDTNKSKANIQSKKNLHIHFADSNGLESRAVNGPDSDQTYSKVVPLHIRTDHSNNGSSPESVASKPNSTQGSPNDSPDDGYGTNSSSGTVSSPFSSSFGSNDLEISYNGNNKKVILPNGAIKPNSVRESWAVKRKQRMIESSDNTVQEQLRQLTIIEEEGSGSAQRRTSDHEYKNRHGMNIIDSGRSMSSDKIVLKHKGPLDANVRDISGSEPFINVSPNDLRRVNRQLYVVDNDRMINGRSQRSVERTLPQTPSGTNEINSVPRVPPSYNSLPTRSMNRNSDDVFVSQNVQQPSVPLENGESSTWDMESESSMGDSLNSGPLLLRGGAEQKYRTPSGSGKIYVSPSGDEGFYSLNRSSRSTSVSSFQPITDTSDVEIDTNNEQRSPLEVLSGDFLEKWSEMDLNYRNYYGFDEQVEKYSRTDSKVNYFQEKKINSVYGQDNYYRPPNYGSELAPTSSQSQGQSDNVSQGSSIQGIQRDSRDKNGSVPKPATATSAGNKSGKGDKDKDSGSSKSKFFQILPNMFKPSKKQNNASSDSKGSKSKSKTLPVAMETPVEVTHIPTNYEPESEYINIGDLPQYSLAAIEYEEKLKKGQYVSMESLRKRPVFASSRDIKKLFSTHDQSFDSISSPGTQRHSFHAMPLSYRYQVSANQSNDDDMRPRAQSTSATMRSQQIRASVENRMAMISRKNAAVMNQRLKPGHNDSNEGNVSFQSNTSSQRLSGSRKRLDSGNSGSSDSKLSTLV
ncbi:hypothetical protein ACF0H5_019856 [Mactra antiquata]